MTATSDARGTHSKIPSMEELQTRVKKCTSCPLCEGRTNTVFGEGPAPARVMIIGEAPGRNEDIQGRPFVGAAGRLLDELLAEAGLRRSDVYIANVLKCRPPSNRDPRPEEIGQCADYLRDQVRIVSPEIIITLGNFATRFILKTDKGITSLHGKPERTGRFVVYPVYHPAAALYDPTKKDALAKDFRALRGLLDASR